MTCSVRTYGECACPADTCRVQPPKAQQAPVLIATWKMQLATMTAGLLVFGFVFVAMSAWNEQLRRDKIDCQERCVASWK